VIDGTGRVTGIATGTATGEAVVVLVEMTTGSRTDETVVTVMCVPSLCSLSVSLMWWLMGPIITAPSTHPQPFALKEAFELSSSQIPPV
jgi:hypothetical protein